jgi:hypothetical protein
MMRALILTALLLGSDWSSFRGPNGSGIAQTTGLPSELGPDRGVLWKTAVPPGVSSPILTADGIFLTAHEGNQLVTLRIERSSGVASWRRTLERPRAEALHRLNQPSSPTPATDGSNVYAFFGDFGLVSYGPGGTERWRKALGPFSNLHGISHARSRATRSLDFFAEVPATGRVVLIDGGQVAGGGILTGY